MGSGGERPTARFKRGYKWTYLYGFVHPQSGRVFWMILPTVNTELFSLALEEFAREVGAGEDKHVVLVVDQAGCTPREARLPEGIHLEFLPSGSPELQPAERLWPLSNEALANGLFEEIEQIEQALLHRCVELLDQAELIAGLTNYIYLILCTYLVLVRPNAWKVPVANFALTVFSRKFVPRK